MPRPLTEAADYAQITLRLPQEMLRELKAKAHAIHRPMNTEILLLLKDALQRDAASAARTTTTPPPGTPPSAPR